ncbi:DUF262 domain-containing protein [Phenylobacterium sp. J426]|uniref:DUF262 domain-containing protein n=1 Tax=Phenylobacterium sp. J426 TaxID=2898439 RepID=UPI0021507665|nr:DUF262 domain-containing protein [Phenylobacterium sp. J426]MCR5874221.1 DUF262 domain-containing protein [Phenylobacterium sp. J426]
MGVENQRTLADRLFPIVQEEDELELRNVPPEQRRLHTETADLTVSSLHSYLANGKLEIPEFQRGYVWTRNQASRLIESLLIQCPIPVVYFSQTSDNKLLVIDGNQRLLSLKLFLNDGFELQGLTTYPELNGLSWSTLDPRFRDHINNRTIRCITILRETHPQIKFDVFERLNTGSVKLNAQELRHGINHGLLIETVDRQAKGDAWRTITGTRKDTRMRGAELILRYYAFRHARDKYEKPLASFLDAFSATHQKISAEQMAIWERDFQDTLELIHKLLGRYAFRIYDKSLGSPTGFNAALYDAEMIGFAETGSALIKSGEVDPATFQRRVADLFGDEKFSNSIRQATSDETAVKTRIDMFKGFLDNYAV